MSNSSQKLKTFVFSLVSHINKKQIPSIYKKLPFVEDGNYQFIYF